MTFKILYGEDVDVAFLSKLDPVDEACYEPKYWGEAENTIARYEKNRQQFVFVLDEETQELAGYLNFFPCEQGLYADNLSECDYIRDDDITPDEVAPYRHDENHLFILSICVHPQYQGGGVIKLLTDGFISYLNKLEEQGYPITDIMGTAVSPHGKKALRNMLFRELRVLGDGNTVFICDGAGLRKFLQNDLFFASYKADYWMMIPLAEHEANLRVTRLLDEYETQSAQDGNADEDAKLGALLVEELRERLSYECTNKVAEDIELAYLGTYDFLHTTDEYAGLDDPADEVVVNTNRGTAVLVAHRKTHMFILAVVLPRYANSVTQMEDQLSYGYMRIRNPRNPSQFISFYEHLRLTYGLHQCGQPKSLLYLSNLPESHLELTNMLAAEAVDNYGRDYTLKSAELDALANTDRSQYEDYQVYLSSRAVVYVPWRFHEQVSQRIDVFVDYVFVVLIALFQNTALEKVNNRVTAILEERSDISPKVKLAIDEEYGKTVRFWENQNFKYLAAQYESEAIRQAFLSQEMHDMYNEHQEYLEHVVSVKAAISDNRNATILSVVATVLAIISAQPFIVNLMKGLYGFLGIEAVYAEASVNFGLFGGIVVFFLLALLYMRKKGNDHQLGQGR